MSTERETTRIVRSWLLVDEHESADRVLDMVLDQLDTTQQRRAGWPARRTITMNKFMTIGLAAAAVLVAVLVGIQLFGSSSGVGGPDAEQSPTPEATASPDASAAAIPLPDGGSLAAGRYSISDPYPFTISFEAPEGWLACNFDPYEQGVCENREVGGAGVAFLVVENVVADPCSDAGLDPAVGPSVDDLVTAISNLSGFEASTPTDASVDGYPAKRFTVTAPMTSACQLRTWITPTRTNGVGLGEENLVLVVDVDGERMMVSAAYSPALATDAQMQAVEDVIASITIDP
jgi:hypothetical protein